MSPRAQRAPARTRTGVAHRRIAPDPQCRHAGRQPRHGFTRGRHPPGAGRARCHASSSPAGRAGAAVKLDELVVGPKRTTLGPGEIIVEIRLPAASGSQEFLKVGTRNAMVIAVANVALVVDWAGQSVRCALGSVGPVVIRAGDAERFVSSRIDWTERTLGESGAAVEFAALVRARRATHRRSPLHGGLSSPRRRCLRRPGPRSASSPTSRGRAIGAPPDGRADRLRASDQRRAARRRRGVARREPALRAARAPRLARLEERL